MNKFIAAFLCITIIGFIACKNNKKGNEKIILEPTASMPAQDSAKDAATIRKLVIDFYNWYNKNYSRFQEYNLYSSIKKKDKPPYKINWDQVATYQDFIRTAVPQLGQEFISNQKRFFQQCDAAFKANVEDDMPYGFDYDWYTNSQEDPQYLVDAINKSTTWHITPFGDYATVEVKEEFDNNGKKELTTILLLTMKKENGQWTIAKIGNE